jgi:hypothetical protein
VIGGAYGKLLVLIPFARYEYFLDFQINSNFEFINRQVKCFTIKGGFKYAKVFYDMGIR